MEFLVAFELNIRRRPVPRSERGAAQLSPRALPLSDWMQTAVTPLAPHPNDPR
jgi:hypothetical protein